MRGTEFGDTELVKHGLTEISDACNNIRKSLSRMHGIISLKNILIHHTVVNNMGG